MIFATTRSCTPTYTLIVFTTLLTTDVFDFNIYVLQCHHYVTLFTIIHVHVLTYIHVDMHALENGPLFLSSTVSSLEHQNENIDMF